MSGRIYTIEDYRRDVRELDSIGAPAPATRELLARRLIEDAFPAPESAPPPESAPESTARAVARRPTLLGLAPVDGDRFPQTRALLLELAAGLAPATEACQRAAGISQRPEPRSPR